MSEMENAQSILNDPTKRIEEKMRALFYLRNVLTDESALIIGDAIYKNTSVLLKHVMAYVLGQMRLQCSKEILIKVLDDENEDEVTRHECAEALGNFNDKEMVPILEKYLRHASLPLKETCYLAIKKIQENKDGVDLSKFDSRDPAVPLFEDINEQNIECAGKMLDDPNECLYRKYKAMFYLRDCGTEKAKKFLIDAFKDESALLKHELAFIMGQMRMDEGIEVLNKVMNDGNEHGMVRHEAAEALGAIATDDCYRYLQKNIDSDCDILRESVLVALDVLHYENGEEAEYACVL